MTLDDLFEHFGMLVNAPDGVPRLRELILQTAVQGKLVEQNEKDEPVDVLLERIGRARKSSHVTRPTDSAGVVLPSGWAMVCINQIADHRLGKMLDKGKNRGDLVPYLRNTNVQWSRFNLDDIKEMRFHKDEIAEYEVHIGDLLICEGGEPGRCAVWTDSTRAMFFQKAIHRVRPLGGICPFFLALRLQIDAISGRLDEQFTGATIKHFTGQELARYSFPLPPLAEQKRIVATVDPLMALCDALEAQQQARHAVRSRLQATLLGNLQAAANAADFGRAWQRLRDHFAELFGPGEAALDAVAQLRQTILQLAVQGKLVPQGTNEEPSTWNEMPLAKLLREDSLNGYSKQPSAVPGGVEILRISAGTSRKDGIVNEDDFKWAVLNDDEAQKFRLHEGDLLACRFNGNLHYVGRFSLYTGYTSKEQVFPDKLIRFRVDQRLCDPRYVCLAMNSSMIRTRIEAFCATTAGNIGISASNLKTVEVPIPPLAEQRRIVAKVQQLMAQCDALEASLKEAATVSERWAAAAVRQLLAPPPNDCPDLSRPKLP